MDSCVCSLLLTPPRIRHIALYDLVTSLEMYASISALYFLETWLFINRTCSPGPSSRFGKRFKLIRLFCFNSSAFNTVRRCTSFCKFLSLELWTTSAFSPHSALLVSAFAWITPTLRRAVSYAYFAVTLPEPRDFTVFGVFVLDRLSLISAIIEVGDDWKCRIGPSHVIYALLYVKTLTQSSCN